jgi:hypothetical protein
LKRTLISPQTQNRRPDHVAAQTIASSITVASIPPCTMPSKPMSSARGAKVDRHDPVSVSTNSESFRPNGFWRPQTRQPLV